MLPCKKTYHTISTHHQPLNKYQQILRFYLEKKPRFHEKNHQFLPQNLGAVERVSFYKKTHRAFKIRAPLWKKCENRHELKANLKEDRKRARAECDVVIWMSLKNLKDMKYTKKTIWWAIFGWRKKKCKNVTKKTGFFPLKKNPHKT